jgi:hypothetical protein
VSFIGCIKLTAINVDPGNSNYSAQGGMLLSKDGKTLISYPSVVGDVTLDGITTVGEYAFFGCTGLTTVSLPEATTISQYAFSDCTALETVSLPAVTSIGGYVFILCTALETVTLGDTPPTLGVNMFYDITGTKSVTVKVPNIPAWSGIIGSFTDAENTTGGPHWGEGFRGKGWTGGGAYPASPGTVNENINLTSTAAP